MFKLDNHLADKSDNSCESLYKQQSIIKSQGFTIIIVVQNKNNLATGTLPYGMLLAHY